LPSYTSYVYGTQQNYRRIHKLHIRKSLWRRATIPCAHQLDAMDIDIDMYADEEEYDRLILAKIDAEMQERRKTRERNSGEQFYQSILQEFQAFSSQAISATMAIGLATMEALDKLVVPLGST
jgi:hypothetical protein